MIYSLWGDHRQSCFFSQNLQKCVWKMAVSINLMFYFFFFFFWMQPAIQSNRWIFTKVMDGFALKLQKETRLRVSQLTSLQKSVVIAAYYCFLTFQWKPRRLLMEKPNDGFRWKYMKWAYFRWKKLKYMCRVFFNATVWLITVIKPCSLVCYMKFLTSNMRLCINVI